MFEEAEILVYMRSRDVNERAPRIEGVTPHNFAYIRSRPSATSRAL